MVEKIEKVYRIKGVDYDVGRRFNSGRQREESGNDFATELKRVINKKTERKPSEIPEAYSLELTSLGSQSLFYFGGTDLGALLN